MRVFGLTLFFMFLECIECVVCSFLHGFSQKCYKLNFLHYFVMEYDIK